MIRQFSAGGIVLRQAQDKFSKEKKAWEVLLVHNTSIKDKKTSFWGFPKGHLEEGESSKEAALREVEEETGIKAKIIEKVGQSKYIFTVKGEKIFKVVAVFLMEYLSGEAKPQLSEIIEVKWMSPDEALKILSFKNDKDLLKKALELIDNR